MDTTGQVQTAGALYARLLRFDGTSVGLEQELTDGGASLMATLTYDRAEIDLTVHEDSCAIAWSIHHRGWYMHTGSIEFRASDQQRWSRAGNLFQLLGTYPLVVRGATRPLPWRKPWELACGSVIIDSGDGHIPPGQQVEVILLPAVG